MLARSKLNRTESKISKALTDNEISHEEFETLINEEKKYRELKARIKMMNSQRSNAEKVNLIEEGKKTAINEVIKRNELLITIWNNIFNLVSIKRKSYCLNCRKNTDNMNQKQVMVRQCYYQNVQYAIVKNPDLLKIKKQKDYLAI